MHYNSKVFKILSSAMLGSIAYLLMMFNFPLPGFPVFLKIDFSEIPALLGAIIFGPAAGISIEALKNFLHYGLQGSFTGVPVGQLANFIAGVSFILPVSYFARKVRSKKGLVYGLTFGSVIMTVLMGVLNYFIILPAYTWFLNAPQMSQEALFSTVLVGITPFNIIKTLILSLVFLALYSKMEPVIDRFNNKRFDAA